MLFFDAFPTLETDKELRNVFSKATVSSVTALPDADDVVVHAVSDKYITGLQIASMEKALFDSVFSKAGRLVSLKVKFDFEDHTDFKAMWEKYRLYMAEEIAVESALLATIYRNAQVSAQDCVITLDIEENYIAREKQSILAGMIIDHWKDHFGIDVKVDFKYHEAVSRDKSRRDETVRVIRKEEPMGANKAENEGLVSPAVDDWFDDLLPDDGMDSAPASSTAGTSEIFTMAAEAKTDANPQGEAASGPAPEGKNSEEDKQAKEPEKKPGKGDQKDYKRKGANSKWKSANSLPPDPDIFYGRNFEGEPIKLSELAEAVGQVVVRGMVRACEDRETRTGKILVNFAITDFT
ncbi:MAG: hypothetical protein IKR54_08260, partial [Lachnospiraceae bacterium]|nr:hypothetical protein [Lachnospiraceae bacterium]